MAFGKMKYYSLKNILTRNAQYNMIFGERSNGKTFAVLEHGLEDYALTGNQMAIVRRWQDDFKGKRAATMFDNLVNAGVISRVTGGEWSGVYYYASRWFLCKFDEDGKRTIQDEPFCFAFAISAMEHDKSTSYPKIKTVMFDEFLTRSMYLPDEFILFMNVLSTIIRERNDVIIFMCGNTINQYSPYFVEMGITHIKQMTPGDIDIYEYGDSGLRVAVEFADSPNKSKPSDVYFAFDNPKLAMITGKNGIWEISVYPHCPVKFLPKEILFMYFIQFNGELLQCEIVQHENLTFTFIHQKTTELKNPDNELIYSPEYDPRPNWKRKITKPITPLEKKIASFFVTDKVFYQDNEIGEIVRNYLMWCKGGEQ